MSLSPEKPSPGRATHRALDILKQAQAEIIAPVHQGHFVNTLLFAAHSWLSQDCSAFESRPGGSPRSAIPTLAAGIEVTPAGRRAL